MISYLLHAALLLAIFFGFYKLLLQRETFYRLNRAILLACISLCFILPLFKVPSGWSLQGSSKLLTVFRAQKIEFSETASKGVIKPGDDVKETIPVSTEDRISNWLWYLYWFGVAAIGLSFILQLIILLYHTYSKPSIKDGRFRIVELSNDKAPCSFFNTIFINPAKYDWDTYEQVLNHEKIHAAQGHSIDIMLAEIALIFQWFNPFAWLYRKELESNLEYLTDEAVLQKDGTKKAVYQESLLKVAVPQLALRLTANYNQSLLKKRLIRMEIKRSNLHTLWKYSFIFPLCFLLVCAFNEPEEIVNNTAPHKATSVSTLSNMTSEGLWYAALNNKEVNFYLKPVNAENKSSAQLTLSAAELLKFTKGDQKSFELSREAGTIRFTGEFDQGKGLGQYQFIPDQKYKDYMTERGISGFSSGTQLAFFFLNITKAYVSSIAQQGISGQELISRRANEINRKSGSGNLSSTAGGISVKSKVSLKSVADDDTELNAAQNRISQPGVYRLIDEETRLRLRDEVLKKALSELPPDLAESRRIQAEKPARQQWAADSLKKQKGGSKVVKVEMPVKIQVESTLPKPNPQPK
jgi:hypothetical protein